MFRSDSIDGEDGRLRPVRCVLAALELGVEPDGLAALHALSDWKMWQFPFLLFCNVSKFLRGP